MSDFLQKLNQNLLAVGEVVSPAVNRVNSEIDNFFKSAYGKVFGTGLTGQQIAQNAWTAAREDTQYQRGVEDMKAAGLNPALMYGNAAQPAPSSPSANPSPGGLSFSDMMQLSQLSAQIGLIDAQTRNVDADTELKSSSQSLNEQLLNFNETYNRLRIEHEGENINLTRSEIAKNHAVIEKVGEEIKFVIAQTASEAEKASLYAAEAALKNMNAWQIQELTPVTKAYYEAETQAQKALASYYSVQALYQKKLLSEGYVDAFIASMKATAQSNEAKAAVDKIASSIKTGDLLVIGDDRSSQTVWQQIGQAALDLCVNYPVATLSWVFKPICQIAGIAVGAEMIGAKVPAKSDLKLSGHELDKYNGLTIH